MKHGSAERPAQWPHSLFAAAWPAGCIQRGGTAAASHQTRVSRDEIETARQAQRWGGSAAAGSDHYRWRYADESGPRKALRFSALGLLRRATMERQPAPENRRTLISSKELPI